MNFIPTCVDFEKHNRQGKDKLGFPWHYVINLNKNILSNLHTCGGEFISFSHELRIAMLNNEKKRKKISH